MSTVAERFWQGYADRKVPYQKCAECGNVQSYPRPICHGCGSKKLDWHEAKPKGTVSGATTVYRAPSKEFESLVPYRLLLVDLKEGFRIMSHAEDDVDVGDKVTIDFKEIGGKMFPYGRKRA